jgi:acetoacetate decarboxylase
MTENAFSIPFISPPYGPPPYPVEEARLVIVRYEADKDAIAAAIPKPLEPRGDGIVTAFAGNMWQTRGPGAYLEGGLVVGVTYKGEPSSYVVILLTSTEEATFVGREVFGLPKLMCDPGSVVVDGNGRRASLVRRGREILSVGANLEESADGVQMLPQHRYMVKSVPSPDPDYPSLRQVVHQKLVGHKVRRAWRGRGWVDVGGDPQIDLTPFARKRVIDGWYIEASWDVPPARVVHEEERYASAAGDRSQRTPVQREPVLARATSESKGGNDD